MADPWSFSGSEREPAVALHEARASPLDAPRLAVRIDRHRQLHGQGRLFTGARHPSEQRTRDELVHHVGGDGVARQPQQRHGVPEARHRADEKAAAGPEVHRQELGLAVLAHDVGIALRGAARGDQDVRLRARGLLEARGEVGIVVGRDAEVDQVGPGARDERREQRAIPVVGRAAAERRGRVDEFVARGQDRHAESPPDRDGVGADAGGQADIVRPEPATGEQHGLAGAHVLAAPSHVLPRAHRAQDAHVAARRFRVFAHHDGIRARGQRRAGHGAHRLPAPHASWVGMAGKRVADDCAA